MLGKVVQTRIMRMFFLLSSVANFHNINENKFSFHLLYQNFALSLHLECADEARKMLSWQDTLPWG